MTPLLESFLSDEKTSYSIVDEHGERSTITLDKFIADVLQLHLANVHDWLQVMYDRVVEKKPQLSRRQKGNFVRALALSEAEKTNSYKETMKELVSSL